ncbi:hypothetical protein BJY00DRAFT_79515 [Aspergillus carlsbadensis]|nr:hypothetical protein BJY00DRAFT_79515 [Aspergillus carlsbadensis]
MFSCNRLRLRVNLPIATALAGLDGITWYLGLELTITLFFFFKRRRGLYFWSCALVAWGAILHTIFSILLEYCIWPGPVEAATMFLLTWVMMVIPQSWVLYSRLNLLMPGAPALGVIKYLLISTSVFIIAPGLSMGIAVEVIPHLARMCFIWDRLQVVAVFIQESALSVLYIVQTRKYLSGRAPLHRRAWPTPSAGTLPPGEQQTATPQTAEEKTVLRHLILANIIIIALDVVVVAVLFADEVFLHNAVKRCVYAIKLKVESEILNRLRDLVSQDATPDISIGIGQSTKTSRGEGSTSGMQLIPAHGGGQSRWVESCVP